MPHTPTSILAKPIDVMRDMIAQSTTFQTFSGTASQALAKVRVFTYEVVDVETELAAGNFATIAEDDSFEREKIAGGSRDFYAPNGGFMVEFFKVLGGSEPNDDGTLSDIEETFGAFQETIGDVLTDIEGVSGSAGNLSVAIATQESANVFPFDGRKQGSDNYIAMILQFQYGL